MERKVSAKRWCKIVSDQRRRRRRRKGRVRDNFNCGNSRISVQKAKSLDSPFDSGKHLAPIDPNTRESTRWPLSVRRCSLHRCYRRPQAPRIIQFSSLALWYFEKLAIRRWNLGIFAEDEILTYYSPLSRNCRRILRYFSLENFNQSTMITHG